MDRIDWSSLNHLQVGKYAEYFVKMEFTLYGFDVYQPEVDYKGIDFIVRKDDRSYCDIQVKGVRNRNYIFFRKKYFKLRDSLFAAIVLLDDDKPADPFLIPSTDWNNPNDLVVSHDFEQSEKSKPEWGLNVSRKNDPLLMKYAFENMVDKL